MTRAVDESGLEQLLGQAVTHEVELELAAFRPVLEARPRPSRRRITTDRSISRITSTRAGWPTGSKSG